MSQQIQRPDQPSYREIRAAYDEQRITVYQAYSPEIAIAAVEQQRLSASPAFKLSRMTWIKPSWAWMMYRSGYSHKDARQERILAIKMKRENFQHLLSLSSLSMTGKDGHGPLSDEDKSKPVRVQWDPERDYKLGVLPYRSIQIGIAGSLAQKWVDEWIDQIEDVTDRARELKRVIDAESGVTIDEIVARGLVPFERVYGLPPDLKQHLGMDETA